MALHVALVSPTQQVWTGEATFVSARTTEGELGVLPGHTPLFGVLVDGAVSIKSSDGSIKEFNVSGGFLSVSNDRVSMRQNYPFSKLVDGPANTLIFPNLSSSNIAYNLIRSIAGVELIGPIIMGLKKPVHVLQLGSSVREIVDMVAIAVVDAQIK